MTAQDLFKTARPPVLTCRQPGQLGVRCDEARRIRAARINPAWLRVDQPSLRDVAGPRDSRARLARWWSLARGHGLQLVQRVLDEPRQILLAVPVDPEPERDLEDRDPRLRGQARGRLTDTSPAQRARER
jgi:hypothetical protein